MADLERPDFIEREPATIEAEAIATAELALGKVLYPAQIERLWLNNQVYRESLVRISIQDAAEQNLINYARGINLDQLGALLDVPRLAASAARTTIRFTRPTAPTSRLVPAGTRVGVPSADVSIWFATIADATIAANATTVDAIAECVTSGEIGNGFTAGQINQLIDPVTEITAVSNLSTSNGGSEIEGDEGYRTRLKLAPNLFSVAGSTGAYQFYALSADQSIVDVAVISPRRVLVNVYPLTLTGTPSVEILDKVDDALQPDNVRPLTDEVVVLAPTAVTYAIAANVVLYTSADGALLQTQLNAAAAAYADAQRAKLGRDVIRSQIVAALSLDGVYSVAVTSPASDTVIAANEWANATSITITITGTNAG